MPIYRCKCSLCHMEFDQITRSWEQPVPCPKCGKPSLKLFYPTRYLVFPYHLNDDERGRVKYQMQKIETSRQARRVAEIADKLNKLPVLEEN